MKLSFIPLILLFPIFVVSQAIDSLLSKRIDSLNKEFKEFDNKNHLDSLYSFSLEIEKLVLEKSGNQSLEYGQCCYLHGKLLYNKSKYTEAEDWLKKALNIFANKLNEEHSFYLQCIQGIAVNYYAKGEYKEAEKWFLKSKDTYFKLHGRLNSDYATSIYWLGNVQMSLKNTSVALNYHLEAKELREALLGKNSADYAASQTSLFNCYLDQSKFKLAEASILEAIEIQRKLLGTLHPSYLSSKDNLANLYRKIGQLDESLAIRKETLEARERVLGKVHPSYATSAFNYANLLNDLGFYEDAENYYLESLGIREKLLGKKHPQYMSSLSGLASLYLSIGDYEKAESYYLQSKQLREEFFGKQNTEYASALSGLANFYRKTGNFKKAESCSLENLRILESNNGNLNIEYAKGLFTLANIYSNQRNYILAESKQLKALELINSLVGPKTNDYAKGLNSLGIIYANLSDFKKADSCFSLALDIRKTLFGKYHRECAKNLTNIASLYFLNKRYKDAEALYIEGMEVQDSILGKDHPDYLESLSFLENLYFTIGDYPKAYPLMIDLVSRTKTAVNRAKQHLTEAELYNYLLLFQDINDRLFSLATNDSMNSMKYIEVGLENILFYKGFLQFSVNQIRNLAHSDSIASKKLILLKSYESRLAKELTKPINEQNNISILEDKINQIEKDLLYSVRTYSNLLKQVSWKDVKNKLKENEAAIEFVHYKFYLPLGSNTSELYGALIFRWDNNQVEFIQLFDHSQLNLLFHSDIAQGKKKDISENYSLVNGTNQLFNMIWKPMENSLRGIQKIYASPSGLLHRLNLAAIPISESEIISDKYDLIEMGSTRNLAVGNYTSADSDSTGLKTKIDHNEAVLYGGIEYDLDSASIFVAKSDLKNEFLASRNTTRGRSDELNFNYTDSASRGRSWYYLKWTEKEISSIESILRYQQIKSSVFKSYAASEESFKSIGAESPSPKILHIATHGFFFPDTKEKFGSSQLAVGSEPVFKISDHPMIRSGLILAGGNHAWKTGKPYKEGMEDGILTAYEISQMNLSNTELVVLSACETGLGDIQGNEGVYGLQRAFKIAGAKYIIMSLWQVPDKQTKEFMETFYKKWLNDKLSIPDAFKKAQKEMQKKFVDPYFWAGMVLVE